MEFWESIENIYSELEKKQNQMDSILNESRELIKLCSKAITLMHVSDIKRAEEIVSELATRKDSLLKDSNSSGMGFYSVQPLQEYAEAKILLGILKERRIMLCDEVGVPQEPYILGLMDVVGELKREVLQALGSDRAKDAEEFLAYMKEIYDSTRGIRFSDSILPGFRRKQDVARAQIESAWSDILSRKD
ncbi:MAG: hypothetical protein QXN59_03145 [Candidatus Micrarchaeaceae archaeon]